VKAFLLAAGVGSRLRPITSATPKCMLVIDDRPLLDIWLDAFDRAGIDEVLVNLHHLPDVVRRHIAARTAPPAVRTFFEPELLGSAGTLIANRRWVDGEEFFLACNADNLTDFDLRSLIDVHREHSAFATIAVFLAAFKDWRRYLAPGEVGVIMIIAADRRQARVIMRYCVGLLKAVPMLANLIVCASIYVLGHLVPMLVNSSVGKFEIVRFVGQFIATVLPVLDHFNIQAAVAAGATVPLGYLGVALCYCILYSSIAMLLALLMFEDRDLA
jgi:molybdopterin-guanine dinucleotide biosynthesis protein A